MKILHIIPAFGGGISSYVKNLITAPNNDNLKMDVAGFGIFPKEYIFSINEMAGNVYSFPNPYRHMLKFLKQYIFILQTGNYDMLHCHISGYKGYIFKLLAKIYGVKIIAVHAHSSDDEKKGKLYFVQLFFSRILTKAYVNVYFTCSDLAAIHKYGKNFCQKNMIIFLPNAISLDLYNYEISKEKKQNYRNELGIEKDQKILGHIGRFNIQKNHFFLLDIFELLLKDDLNYTLLLIGTGQLQDSIKKLVQKKGLEKNVKFLNYRKDINKLLQVIDIVLLPSFFEGLPTVAIEAQAAGTPILLSDTITRQADLEINLAYYISIQNGPKLWCTQIEELFSSFVPVPLATRIDSLRIKGFTAQEMRIVYYETINTYKSNL